MRWSGEWSQFDFGMSTIVPANFLYFAEQKRTLPHLFVHVSEWDWHVFYRTVHLHLRLRMKVASLVRAWLRKWDAANKIRFCRSTHVLASLLLGPWPLSAWGDCQQPVFERRKERDNEREKENESKRNRRGFSRAGFHLWKRGYYCEICDYCNRVCSLAP